jgi:mannose-6-phosphate isomerase class I
MKEVTGAGKVKSRGGNGRVVLVSSPCFEVDKMLLKQEKSFKLEQRPGRSSAHCIVGLRGAGVIESDGAPGVTVGRGEAVVLPASLDSYRIRPQWEFECVRAMLPAESVGQPETQSAAQLCKMTQ